MKTNKDWLLIIVVVTLLCSLALSGRGRTSARVTWEYKYLDTGYITKAEKQLNDLGAQGWELVGIVPHIAQGT